jgi:hypothetical protein
VNPAEQPLKTYHKKGWHVLLYADAVVCQDSEAHTYIIKESTEVLRALPHYLLEYMRKHRILETWECTQLAKIAKNLQLIREQHERFLEDLYTHSLIVPQPT